MDMDVYGHGKRIQETDNPGGVVKRLRGSGIIFRVLTIETETGSTPKIKEQRIMKDQNGRYILEFAEMDVQHDYLYRLFDSIEQSTEITDASFMKSILKEIEIYLNFHFTSEEHLMRTYEVPGFAEHQSDHENMASQFIRYLNDFEAGQLNPAAVRIFLTGWFMEHSEQSDSQYVSYIKEIRSKNGFI